MCSKYDSKVKILSCKNLHRVTKIFWNFFELRARSMITRDWSPDSMWKNPKQISLSLSLSIVIVMSRQIALLVDLVVWFPLKWKYIIIWNYDGFWVKSLLPYMSLDHPWKGSPKSGKWKKKIMKSNNVIHEKKTKVDNHNH